MSKLKKKVTKKIPAYTQINGRAVVYQPGGKPFYLGGAFGSEESKIAYAHYIAEQASKAVFPQKGDTRTPTVRELSADFLDHIRANSDATTYSLYKIIVLDFLSKFFGDDFPVENFKPSSLILVRGEMIRSRRFCRRIVNRYTSRIISIFRWGVERDIVPETVWNALKAVQALPKGYPGTFDNAERGEISDEIVRRTLPFMTPTLRAMVMLQRLTGMRPSEVYEMKVGEIVKDVSHGLWHYVRKKHKTERHIGKKIIPLSRFEQELIEPYLVGKTAEQAVFSPKTSQLERSAERRANRKTKISPSQAEMEKAKAVKPSAHYCEFFSQYTYRQAIKYAVAKANRHLQHGEEPVPHWYPYQLRHAASTDMEKTGGLDKAQALLFHKSTAVTRRYSHGQLVIAEDLARNRRNPFEANSEES